MAIKIIQPGNLDRLKHTIKFSCRACGCMFEADKDDCTTYYGQRENADIGWYEIECPICGKWLLRCFYY